MICFQNISGDWLSGRVHSPIGFKLVVISDPDFLKGEEDVFCRLLDAGVSRLHLRKPLADIQELSGLIEKIPQRYYSRISLHDHHSLALKYGLGGIHLNSRTPTLPETIQSSASLHLKGKPRSSFPFHTRENSQLFAHLYQQDRLHASDVLMHQRVLISRSCHSLEEVIKYRTSCDYVFLSPIFNSVSKQGYDSGFSYEDLIRARDCGIIDSHVFALSGVTPERIPLLQELGFGGCAVLGHIWEPFKKNGTVPVEEFISCASTY